MKSYEHFTLREREKLSKLLSEGKNKTEMARMLGRNRVSIYREIKRNKQKNGEYMPIDATAKYIRRRKKCRRKLRYQSDKLLMRYTRLCLKKYWSPEIIVAKWKMHKPEAELSHATIYRALEKRLISDVSPRTHLRRHNKQKYVRPNSAVIKPDYTIHERPAIANNRGRIGDWEGDTVHGGRGKGFLVTMTDRKSRYLMAALTKSLKSAEVCEVASELMSGEKVETLTLDNGAEFMKHREIAEKLGARVYFADAKSPWQRGTNENINDVLRFFYPKGCDFLAVTQQELDATLDLINTRPRKCLGWLSPKDVFFAKCCT